MPLTRVDWEQWSPEKRNFFAELFTCYSLTGDGVLCIDTEERQRHVLRQLKKQAENKEAEQIVTSSSVVNYVLTDGLQDGKTLAERKIADIRILYLKRTPKSAIPSAHSVHTLVGGFYVSQPIREHLTRAIKEKVLSSDEHKTIASWAKPIPFSDFDDLTVFLRCTIAENEAFLLETTEFKAAIEQKAKVLSGSEKFPISPHVLATQIIDHINICSIQSQRQVSLNGLSVPNVRTYLALYTPKEYEKICRCVQGAKPVETSVFNFEVVSTNLNDLLCEGPSNFAFLSEYLGLLKLSILFPVIAGKPIDQVKEILEKPILESPFLAPLVSQMLMEVAKTQAKKIKDASLPKPPFFMDAIWDPRRQVNEILNILRRVHCIDLYNMAAMVGFSRESAHLAFGLAPSDLLDNVNSTLSGFWKEVLPTLLDGIQQFLEQQHEQKIGNAAALLEEQVQPAGVHLGVRFAAQAAETQKAPGRLGLFYTALAKFAASLEAKGAEPPPKPGPFG